MKLKTIKNMMLPALLSMTLPSYAGDFFDGEHRENGTSKHRMTVSSLFADPSEVKQAPQHKYTLRSDIATRSVEWLESKIKHTETQALSHIAVNGSLSAFDVRSLDSRFPPAFDQQQQNSCTGNSSAGLVTYVRDVEGLPQEVLSRDFPYYNGRAAEGATDEDEGASLADVIESICKYGICRESFYPYSQTPDGLKVKPSPEAYADALNNVDLDNLASDRVQQSLAAMKHTMSVVHRPFVLGIQIYDSFESNEVAQTGIVPMPGTDEHCQGGHAVLAVGYDDNRVNHDGSKGAFTIRNSWGPNWGDNGDFYLPYAYITNAHLAQDLWTMQKVGARPAA